MKALLLSVITFMAISAHADITLEQYQNAIAGTYCIKVDGNWVTDFKFKVVTSPKGSNCTVQILSGDDFSQANCSTQYQPYTHGPITMPTTSILLSQGDNGEDAYAYHFTISAHQAEEGSDTYLPLYLFGMFSVQDHVNNAGSSENLKGKKLYRFDEKTKLCNKLVKTI
jgi:hypothetical protein